MSERGDKQPAVVAIVKGGLGNQLFIYAAARALALRTGRALYLDVKRGYVADTYGRSYRLDRFPIQAAVMPEVWRVAPTLKHPRHKIVRALSKLLPRDRRTYLAERHHLPSAQLTALQPQRERVTLHGYWQDEAYFAACADTIRAELTPPAPVDVRNRELGLRLAEGDAVFVHVRRVHYPELLTADYYQKAVSQARTRLSKPRFVLFGDDLAWLTARVDFGGAEVEAIEHNAGDELADLWLMTCCRHAIIANSSFSWWGAWLGTKAGRQVYAPASVAYGPRPPLRWASS